MKRLLSLVILVFLVSLLIGCSGNGVIPPPPLEEPPIDLIREYIGRDNVVRWANGVVSVCDITGETESIWEEINEIIDGPVSFELTDDTTAPIGIEYFDIEFPFFSGARIENFQIIGYGVGIHPMVQPWDTDVYIQVCLTGIGIEKGKAAEGFTDEMETVIYWLYRLEPGYPLM